MVVINTLKGGETVGEKTIQRTYEGLLGGDYGNLGFFDQEGTHLSPALKVEEMLQLYKGKKVRIAVEETK